MKGFFAVTLLVALSLFWTDCPSAVSVHAPAFFWMWNDRLDVSSLCAQLDDMKENGVEGVCVHPFPKTFRASIASDMSPDYLTQGFLDIYAKVVRHADELGLHAYLYDEGGWPSGGACGQVAASDPSGRFCLRWMRLDKDGKPEVVTQPYAGSAPRTSVVEKGLVERFLSLTHERYATVLGDQMGRTVRVAFTDEPDMPRSVPGESLGWTSDFAEVFQAKKGYDILPFVSELIRRYDETDDRLAQVRIDYHDVMADLMVERYLGPLRAWCRAHGLLSGGHFNCEDEPAATSELGFGSLMRSLRALDAPGVDVIWRQIFPATPSRPAQTGVFPRFAASAAHVNGSVCALSETFGIFGDSVSPAEMRWLVASQLVRGINAFVFAYYAQSNAGQWMYQFEPHNGPVAPSWPMQKPFFTSVRRLSELLSKGKPGADVAVLYDVRGLWAGGADREAAAAGLEAAARALEAMNCDFDFVDDDVLSRATVFSDGGLRVGEMTYHSLVLPTSKWLHPAARKIADAFLRAGGRVVGLDGLPSVPRTLGVSGSDARAVRVLKRVDGKRVLYAVMNEDKEAQTCRLQFPEKGELVRYKPETDAYEWVAENGETTYAFGPGELVVFVSGDVPDYECTDVQLGAKVEMSSGWTLRKVVSHEVGPSDFVVTTCSEPAQPTSLGDWRAFLGERFSGRAVYATTFESALSGRAVLDLGEVRWSASVRLNGRELGAKFSGPFRWDIELAAGTNVLEVTVANLLVNQVGHDDVRDRLARDFPPIGWYDGFQRSFDRENHESGLYGPVSCRLVRPCAAATPMPADATYQNTRRWAGAGFWDRRHAAILKTIAQGPKEYDCVLVGDSITHNWEGWTEAPDVEAAEKAYANGYLKTPVGPGRKVWRELRKRHAILNLGLAGDTTQNVLWRLENGEMDGYRTRLVAVMVGTNSRNSAHPQEIAAGIRAILDKIAEKQPQAKILLMPIFPRGANPDDPARRARERTNRVIRRFADGTRIVWLDFNAKFLNADGTLGADMMPDELHPIEAGYRIWSEALQPYLESTNGISTKVDIAF